MLGGLSRSPKETPPTWIAKRNPTDLGRGRRGLLRAVRDEREYISEYLENSIAYYLWGDPCLM